MQPFFVPANFDPKIFLDEEGSLLTLQIQNVYQTEHGEITVPGPNPDLMTASYLHEGKSYLIARDCDHEQTLITMAAQGLPHPVLAVHFPGGVA